MKIYENTHICRRKKGKARFYMPSFDKFLLTGTLPKTKKSIHEEDA